MRTWVKAIPFFGEKELRCKGDSSENPCGCGSAIKLDIAFAVHLPVLRFEWGEPFTLNSCCRCTIHNKNSKGHESSLHLMKNPKWPTSGTMAGDVPWRHWDDDKQLRFAALAYSLGWSIGLHDGFCHIDRRINCGLKQRVFLYGEWSGQMTKDDIISLASSIN